MSDYERLRKGGRDGKRRDAERAAEIKKSRRGEESNVNRDEHGNFISRSHGKSQIAVVKEKIRHIISEGEYPGYELSRGKDNFVNFFKSNIGDSSVGYANLIKLIQSDDSKDTITLSRDRLRKEAYDNVTKPGKDRLDFLSGLKIMSTFFPGNSFILIISVIK